ncbi:MAG: hypothetical protein ACWGG5_07155 [Stenotrophomonas sp.]
MFKKISDHDARRGVSDSLRMQFLAGLFVGAVVGIGVGRVAGHPGLNQASAGSTRRTTPAPRPAPTPGWWPMPPTRPGPVRGGMATAR